MKCEDNHKKLQRSYNKRQSAMRSPMALGWALPTIVTVALRPAYHPLPHKGAELGPTAHSLARNNGRTCLSESLHA